MRFDVLAVLCLASVLSSCGESSDEPGARRPAASQAGGFEANITGAYEGRVSGSGVLKWLPGAGSEREGYYFLADGQGVRPHGVTFVLPPDITPGKHELKSPAPHRIGTVPSVRVDRDEGGATVSASRKTAGYLDLISFPDGPDGAVEGSFSFETEDREGRRIRVQGGFSFEARQSR